MREFLQKNKSRLIRIFILLVIFFITVSFINGKNLHDEKLKMIQEGTSAVG